jgi:hypothetical protein
MRTLFSLCEKAIRRWHPKAKKKVLTRHWSCWHPDLELVSVQNHKKLMFVVKSMVLCEQPELTKLDIVPKLSNLKTFGISQFLWVRNRGVVTWVPQPCVSQAALKVLTWANQEDLLPSSYLWLLG